MDVVCAIVGLAESDEASGKVFNIGSEEEISIMDLAKQIKEKTNSHSEIKIVPYALAYDDGFEDMQYRKPNIERIKALIGWKSNYRLHEILNEVIIYQRNKNAQIN